MNKTSESLQVPASAHLTQGMSGCAEVCCQRPEGEERDVQITGAATYSYLQNKSSHWLLTLNRCSRKLQIHVQGLGSEKGIQVREADFCFDQEASGVGQIGDTLEEEGTAEGHWASQV